MDKNDGNQESPYDHITVSEEAPVLHPSPDPNLAHVYSSSSVEPLTLNEDQRFAHAVITHAPDATIDQEHHHHQYVAHTHDTITNPSASTKPIIQPALNDVGYSSQLQLNHGVYHHSESQTVLPNSLTVESYSATPYVYNQVPYVAVAGSPTSAPTPQWVQPPIGLYPPTTPWTTSPVLMSIPKQTAVVGSHATVTTDVLGNYAYNQPPTQWSISPTRVPAHTVGAPTSVFESTGYPHISEPVVIPSETNVQSVHFAQVNSVMTYTEPSPPSSNYSISNAGDTIPPLAPIPFHHTPSELSSRSIEKKSFRGEAFTSPLDDPDFCPRPEFKSIYDSQLLAAYAPQTASPLPDHKKITHSGSILSRISLRAIFFKSWKPVVWITFGPNAVYFFRSTSDLETWATNPYLTQAQRDFLVKLKIDFVYDLNKSGLRSYAATALKYKQYESEMLYVSFR
jgi:hypothetical protein